MKILISGGSGFIGKALTKSLLADGHEIVVLTRNPQTAGLEAGVEAIRWDGRTDSGWGGVMARVDGIINLAGASIGSGLWTRKRKEEILESRVEAGKALTEAISKAARKPKVLIQASAVGFYGVRGEEAVSEESGGGSDYLAEVCKAWEASTKPVEDIGVRRVVIRSGVVLSAKEGPLPRMVLPFRFFAGGPLGDGKQGFPWIHPDDEQAAILDLLQNEKASGVYNLCAPKALSNADFGRVIAKVMKRPYWLPAPAFALRLLLGEMSSLVLDGQYVIPVRLQELGFHFRFETAESALEDLLKGK